MEYAEENIDCNEWLPKSPEELYPHRLKRGIVHKNRSSIEMDDSKAPIDVLYREGYITDAQHHTGVFILETRRMVNHHLGTDRLRDTFVQFFGESVERDISPGVLLVKAMEGLKPYHRNIVDRLTALPKGDYDRDSRPLTEQDTKWVRHCMGTLREGLDIVRDNVDRIRKEGGVMGNISRDIYQALDQAMPLDCPHEKFDWRTQKLLGPDGYVRLKRTCMKCDALKSIGYDPALEKKENW